MDYILEGANSAITFSIPFAEDDLNENIDRYLSKENHKDLEKQKVRATTLANGIALEITGLLNQIGYEAEPVHSNFVYRKNHHQNIGYHHYLTNFWLLEVELATWVIPD